MSFFLLCNQWYGLGSQWKSTEKPEGESTGKTQEQTTMRKAFHMKLPIEFHLHAKISRLKFLGAMVMVDICDLNIACLWTKYKGITYI